MNPATGGSYRTYEEWKPASANLFSGLYACSYRTYEEWKLSKNRTVCGSVIFVLTVPMRNGNCNGWKW